MAAKYCKLQLVAFVLFAAVVHIGSSESVVYSSNDRADNQRAHTAQSNHLPTPTGTNQKDLTLYSGEKPGEKQAEGLLQTIPVSTSQPPTAPLTTSGILCSQ